MYYNQKEVEPSPSNRFTMKAIFAADFGKRAVPRSNLANIPADVSLLCVRYSSGSPAKTRNSSHSMSFTNTELP